MIPSYRQATALGEATGQPFLVFSYEYGKTGLTAFAVRTDTTLITRLPSAAVPAHP